MINFENKETNISCINLIIHIEISDTYHLCIGNNEKLTGKRKMTETSNSIRINAIEISKLNLNVA